MNAITRLGAFATVPLLALSLAAPAHAGGYTYYDKAGDVAVESCNVDTYDCVYPADSSIKAGDVIRSTVLHHAHNVELRTTYRELSAVGHFSAEIRTNEQVLRWVEVSYDASRGIDVAISAPRGRSVTCSVSVTGLVLTQHHRREDPSPMPLTTSLGAGRVVARDQGAQQRYRGH